MSVGPDKAEIGSVRWHEEQESRDAAGQLRAIEQGGRDRARLDRGEITQRQLEQEWDDDIARIGSFTDAEWDAMTTPRERHEALSAFVSLGQHDH